MTIGAFHREARPLRQPDIGPDPGGDHQHVAVQRAAVGEHGCRSRCAPQFARRCASVGVRLSPCATVRFRCPFRTAPSARICGIRPDRRVGRSSGSARRARHRRPCPRLCRPRAASSPSSPPPITTALVRLAASAIIVAVSSSVRNPNTPSVKALLSAHKPVIGGKNDLLPVARISLS